MAHGKKKILMVDDEIPFCDSVKKNLEMSGAYEVFICPDAPVAVQQAEEIRPDLILLDIMMPGKLGLDVRKDLKARPQTQKIPILFLTALPLEQEGEEFLIKPVQREVLRAKIEEVLAKSRV